MQKRLACTAALALSLCLFTTAAYAQQPNPRGVGLGVAAGVDVNNAEHIDTNATFSWGFFVDIPLLETFYITPAAMIYELDIGRDKKPVTDVDLNFKFIVPLGA